MERLRPDFCAKLPKKFKEFSFLQSSKDYFFKSFSYPKVLGHVEQFEITPKNLKNYQKLSKFLTDSKFGKGSSTQLDKNVRNSKEILSEHIILTPEFSKELQVQVDEMAKILKHPKQVECHLAKMVIYEKGGHFKSHIDSNHKPNMIFTLSVEIFVNADNKGGILKMDKVDVPASNKEDELILALFYHDVKHEVTELTRGIRICLIFDVLELETFLQSEIKNVNINFSKVFNLSKKLVLEKLELY